MLNVYLKYTWKFTEEEVASTLVCAAKLGLHASLADACQLKGVLSMCVSLRKVPPVTVVRL